MKNQDMPANPISNKNLLELPNLCVTESLGETKFEKAFWQVYSANLSNSSLDVLNFDDLAMSTLEAVHAGFKALENNNE